MSAPLPTTTNPLLTVQLQPKPQETPLIAQFLSPNLPHIEDLPLQGIDVTPGALAFEFSHDRIAEAFERLQDDIKLWSADLARDSAAAGHTDLPEEVMEQLQQQQQQQEGDGEAGSASANAQSAASEQGSAETSSTGHEGKHTFPFLAAMLANSHAKQSQSQDTLIRMSPTSLTALNSLCNAVICLTWRLLADPSSLLGYGYHSLQANLCPRCAIAVQPSNAWSTEWCVFAVYASLYPRDAMTVPFKA